MLRFYISPLQCANHYINTVQESKKMLLEKYSYQVVSTSVVEY